MDATTQAMMLFQYRQDATGRKLPCDPDWPKVMRDALQPALEGARGATDQEQCAIQGIRLAMWEAGAVPKPWTKAFQPPTPPLSRSRRWWKKVVSRIKSLLKRFHDLV